mmetsp:Transcript_3376/g.9438  ORF Transcript_3376/g.9438 Transcript_3376/m.9438 type:complete len:239 (+) Transcript_3376:806-1522(+)
MDRSVRMARYRSQRNLWTFSKVVRLLSIRDERWVIVFSRALLVRSLSGFLSSSVIVLAKRLTAKPWTPPLNPVPGSSSSSKSFVLNLFSSSAMGHIRSQVPTTGPPDAPSSRDFFFLESLPCLVANRDFFVAFFFSLFMNARVSPLIRPPCPNRSFLKDFLRFSSSSSSPFDVLCPAWRAWLVNAVLVLAVFWLVVYLCKERSLVVPNFCLFLAMSRPSTRRSFSSCSVCCSTCFAHF